MALLKSLFFLLGPGAHVGVPLIMAMAEAQSTKGDLQDVGRPGLRNGSLLLPPHSVGQKKSHGLVQIQRHAPAKSYDTEHE